MEALCRKNMIELSRQDKTRQQIAVYNILQTLMAMAAIINPHSILDDFLFPLL